MYNIKQINDENLYSLLALNKEMRALVSPEANNFGCVSQLVNELTYQDAQATGLFFNGTLVGFVTGYGQQDNSYLCTGLYIQKPHRLQVVKLLKIAQDNIPKNYTSWLSYAMTEESNKFMLSFGGYVYKTIYRKDI